MTEENDIIKVNNRVFGYTGAIGRKYYLIAYLKAFLNRPGFSGELIA